MITDKLKGYTLPEDSRLLLTLGNNHYEIIGDKIQQITTPTNPSLTPRMSLSAR